MRFFIFILVLCVLSVADAKLEGLGAQIKQARLTERQIHRKLLRGMGLEEGRRAVASVSAEEITIRLRPTKAPEGGLAKP